MKAIALASLALLTLVACDQTQQVVSRKNVVPGAGVVSCAGSSSPTCRFRNSPVKLEKTPVRLPRRSLVFYPTAEELAFVDAAKRTWVAPRRTLTDGASIPDAFIAMIGNPKSPEFANAAAIHDAYCGVGNEAGPKYHSTDWRSVHRMFYDALRVGGTPEGKAKIMYAAVYIGGPRWGEIDHGSGSAGRSAPGNTGLSPTALRQVLRGTIGFIQSENPSLPQIEDFADGLLSSEQAALHGTGEGGRTADAAGQDPAGGGSGAPIGPGTPATPGPNDPAAPGTPGTPGTADPATPGTTDPTAPGTADPATPGTATGSSGATAPVI